MFMRTDITLIYDGECRFCSACLAWVEMKLEISAIPFQEANLDEYGLLRSQCEQSVVLITEKERLFGAAAVGYLLDRRGNTRPAQALRLLGRAGQWGYRWVASHRDSLVIRMVTKHLEGIVTHKR